MTIEEKADNYIEPYRSYLLGCETDLMKEAYLAGATEALEAQWVSVEDRIPPDGLVILCQRRKENDNAIALCVYIKNSYMVYDRTFKYNKEFHPTHWMRIPAVKENTVI